MSNIDWDIRRQAEREFYQFTKCDRVVEFESAYNGRVEAAALNFAERAIRAERTIAEKDARIAELLAKAMSCDRDTHRVNNPIWEEEKP